MKLKRRNLKGLLRGIFTNKKAPVLGAHYDN